MILNYILNNMELYLLLKYNLCIFHCRKNRFYFRWEHNQYHNNMMLLFLNLFHYQSKRCSIHDQYQHHNDNFYKFYLKISNNMIHIIYMLYLKNRLWIHILSNYPFHIFHMYQIYPIYILYLSILDMYIYNLSDFLQLQLHYIFYILENLYCN